MKPIPILMYHQIDVPPPKGTPMRGLVVSARTFYSHMLVLWLCGYRGLSMSELEPYLQGKKEGKVFGITFDDGYLNNLVNALPVLNRFGYSSTCYLVANNIGKTNDWDVGKGIAQVPLMNVQQIKQWVAGGQEVGSHGMTHSNLQNLSDEQQVDEIVRSKSALEALLENEAEVRHFCYPYGAYNQYSMLAVAKAGYQTATTTARARVFDMSNTHLHELPRVLVSRTTTWVHLLLKCLTRYEVKRGN
jgi:peptidoglycan/xylan/chitin deacetylase (PgdA/CDA1 family)